MLHGVAFVFRALGRFLASAFSPRPSPLSPRPLPFTFLLVPFLFLSPFLSSALFNEDYIYLIRETALAFPVEESSLGGNLIRLPWAPYRRAISPVISSSWREERAGRLLGSHSCNSLWLELV